MCRNWKGQPCPGLQRSSIRSPAPSAEDVARRTGSRLRTFIPRKPPLRPFVGQRVPKYSWTGAQPGRELGRRLRASASHAASKMSMKGKDRAAIARGYDGVLHPGRFCTTTSCAQHVTNSGIGPTVKRPCCITPTVQLQPNEIKRAKRAHNSSAVRLQPFVSCQRASRYWSTNCRGVRTKICRHPDSSSKC